MTDLRAIAVRVNDDEKGTEYDDGHVEIIIEPANWEAFNGEECTVREWWLACIDVAGIIGRVALRLAPLVSLSAARHQCVRSLSTSDWPLLNGCHMARDRSVLRPGEDLGSNPGLWLYVPRGTETDWLRHIRLALEAIAEDANALHTLDPLEDQNRDTPTTTTTDHANSSALDGATSVSALRPVTHAWTDDGSGISCRQCGMPGAHACHGEEAVS